MRVFSFLAVVLGLAMMLGSAAPAEAARRVTKIRTVDPVTGIETTRIIKERRAKNRLNRRGRAWGFNRRFGAPVVVTGFGRRPYHGQTLWRAGRLWVYDRFDRRWELR